MFSLYSFMNGDVETALESLPVGTAVTFSIDIIMSEDPAGGQPRTMAGVTAISTFPDLNPNPAACQSR
jgi:hypothetical protein